MSENKEDIQADQRGRGAGGDDVVLERVTVASGRSLTVKRRACSPFREGDGARPAISVIVPVYGAEKTLEQAVRSVMSQSVRDIEIICVNDASPDLSGEILERLLSEDGRLVIADHDRNAGYGASMNDGISLACGKWIAILEPDDYLLPGMYEKMLAFHESVSNGMGEASRNEAGNGAGAQGGNDIAAPQVDIIKSAYIREIREGGTERGGAPKKMLNCSYRHRISPASQPFDLFDKGASHILRHHPSIWSALYRRGFLEERGISFREHPGAGWADNEFFYETMLSAEGICYLDEAFYVYREETPGEFDRFARENKALAFDRWHSMGEILSRSRYAQDEETNKSHVSKGFTYLQGALSANTGAGGRTDNDVAREMGRMFQAMELASVISEPKINPDLKKRFLKFRGVSGEELDEMMGRAKAMYGRGLIGEMFYAIRNNGLGFAMEQVAKIARKRHGSDETEKARWR